MKNTHFVGRVTKDAEVVERNGIPVCNFNVAVNSRKATAEKDANGKRIYSQTTDYFRVTLWRDYAKAMAPHLYKGRLIYGEGDFRLETWMDRQNQIHPILHLDSPTLEFLDAGKTREEEPPTESVEAPAESVAVDAEELPFD